MPDVALLQLARNGSHSAGTVRDEMLRLAAEVKAKHPNRFVSHHARTTKRRTLAVKTATAAPATSVWTAKTSKAVRSTTAVRVLDSSLGHLAHSAVAVAKHSQSLEATPKNLQECVSEKQRISSDITAARSAKEEAATRAKL